LCALGVRGGVCEGEEGRGGGGEVWIKFGREARAWQGCGGKAGDEIRWRRKHEQSYYMRLISCGKRFCSSCLALKSVNIE
jgi:hypothetical protein